MGALSEAEELSQVKQDIERRLQQKDEEFASTKKNFGNALEGMQMALEGETKGKVEALRMKKKLEGDVLDLETSLEHANAANAESQKNIKMIQQLLRITSLQQIEDAMPIKMPLRKPVLFWSNQTG